MSSSRRVIRATGLAAACLALLATPAAAHRVVRARGSGRWWIVHAAFPHRTTVVVRGPQHALVDFNVEPGSTAIWVDGTFRGTCDEFDGHPQKMGLSPGRHRIRLVFPDGREHLRTVELYPGYELELDIP